MKKQTAERSGRTIFLLTVLLVVGSILLLQTVLGSSECQVTVNIAGRLVDAAGRPKPLEILTITFYVSPEKPDITKTITTDERGEFLLQTQIPQNAYENSGFHCVELQAWIFFPDEDAVVQYTPGTPQRMSEQNSYAGWAVAGNYEGGYMRLFHSVRTIDSNGPPDFADQEIQLGSRAEPCLFQLGEDLVSANGLVTVQHLAASNGATLIPAEQRVLTLDQLRTEKITARSAPELTDQAPARIEAGGQIVAEAQPDRPLKEYSLGMLPTEVLDQFPASDLELAFYYHIDRDNDGVPDYEVTEQYVSPSGASLTGQAQQSQVYAHGGSYQGRAPAISGYRYVGYQTKGGQLTTGLPEVVITADATYQFVYEKRSGGGSGSGKEEPETPPAGEQGGSGPEPTAPPTETGPDENTEEPWEPPTVLPPEPEPEPGPPEAPLPEAEPTALAKINQTTAQNTASQPPPVLTEEERAERRNVTFIKWSYRQEAQPGETITYGFTGFENEFPYPLQEFTIVDRPDPGLDLLSLEMPAFRQATGVSYDVTCRTNLRREILIGQAYPAMAPAMLEPPDLQAGEYITKITLLFGEVPVGFGQGDEIRITFQIWDDPPQDDLHNLGVLYYEEQGERVERWSDDDRSLVAIRDVSNQKTLDLQTGPEANQGEVAGELGTVRTRNHTKLLWLVLLLATGAVASTSTVTAVKHKKRRKR